MLKIRSAGAADHERIAGERGASAVEHEGHAAVRVARCRARFERMLAEPDAVAVAERDVHARRARRGRYRDAAAGPRSEQRRAGNVGGVHVRVERITNAKPELAK